MQIEIMKTEPGVILPTSADGDNAGWDLYAYIPDNPHRIVIPPGRTEFIRTGIACAIPNGYFGGIYARSGLACKRHLRPANCVGVVDASYRGEIMVALRNDGETTEIIGRNERIAQLIIQKYEPVEWKPVNRLDETVRGEGGFGSTGK